MTPLQERHRPWDEREGLIAIGHLPIRAARRSLTRSLWTMDAAVRLFDTVAALLGDCAWLDPEGGEHRRRLLVRDRERAEWLAPEALLEQAWRSGIARTTGALLRFSDPILPADAPDGWKAGDPSFEEPEPPPDILPTGRLMRGGALRVAEGPSHVELLYGDDGLLVETCESALDQFTAVRYGGLRPYTIDPLARPPTPRPLGLFCRADLEPRGHVVEVLARMVAELDPWGASPARVRLPLPLPDGAAGAWQRALPGIRRALFEGRVSDSARFVVADGLAGTAVASGATLDEAVAAWEAEVERVRPMPPAAPPELRRIGGPPDSGPKVVEDEEGRVRSVSSGVMTLRGPQGGDVPWPVPAPRNVPAAFVPVAPPPGPPPPHLRDAGFARWVAVVGGHGNVAHVLLREGERGLTLVGDGVLDLVDPATLDDELDAAEREEVEMMEEAGGEHPSRRFPASVTSWRFWDDARRVRTPPKPAGGGYSAAFDPGAIDGDSARWAVTRVRVGARGRG